MFRRIFFAALASLIAVNSSFAGEAKTGDTKAKRPNIILIMADDLGWGELGCYGQTKIKTPRIDRMAKEGMRFTQFYTGSPVCAPSRCVLMTGLHSGHAFIRDNRQAKPKEEGQLPVPANTITIASLLKARGYRTGMFGKWGLGMFGTSGDPLRLGFDDFFGYNCQGHAHSFYPTHLYRQDQRVDLEGNDIKSGKQYSHDLIEAEALQFIKKNRDGPFFLYVPMTLPHLALQIPEADLAAYKGAFPETPYDGKQGYQPHPTPRAAYAAMVTRVDRTVGAILDLLKELNLDENTIVLFTSDNGATHLNVGGADSPFFRSMGPLRGWKGSIHEGGLRTPMIVRWPGRVPPGKTSDLIAAFQDVLPTLCQVAGVEPPKTDGISFLPTLLAKGEQRTHPYLYFEFAGYGGQQGVRMGPWKATRVNMQKGNLEIELFNLDTDIGQTKNVAAEHPEVMARIERILREEHVPSAEFPLKAIDGKKE